MVKVGTTCPDCGSKDGSPAKDDDKENEDSEDIIASEKDGKYGGSTCN